MFKIISAEIKKIVSKPGIYILSVLLALILVLGVFIYKPTTYKSNQFELKGSTFVEKYTDFTYSSVAGKRAETQNKISKAIKSVENYTINVSSTEQTQKEYISSLTAKFEEIYNTYQDCATDSSYQAHINTTRENLVTSLENLNTALENALINTQNGSFTILTSKENHTNYKTNYNAVLEWAKINVEKNNLKSHLIEFETKYKSNFYTSLNNFKYPTLSKEFIETYTKDIAGSKLNTLNQRLDNISNEITTLYNQAVADGTINIKSASKMDELANLYVNTADTFVNLIKYELITNAFSNISSTEELNTLYLSDFSSYNSKSLLVRYKYLFDNNKSEFDYAKPLTIGISSNNETNAFDYTYFILKVFSFVIIIYSIMSACHSVAGEIKEGSMRYLSIRPVSRTNILLGKWLSIVLISVILMLFSLIISLCVGWAVYGLAGKEILTIFNGSYAFTIHPLGMIGIFLISMLFELLIYSLIAMLLSVLFKSDLISMTILLVVYLLNTLLPMFVQGSNTLLAFYPFSHISLYSFFGSSVYAVQSNFFNLIFGAKIYATSHIALSISVIMLLIIGLILLSCKLFKKKEL